LRGTERKMKKERRSRQGEFSASAHLHSDNSGRERTTKKGSTPTSGIKQRGKEKEKRGNRPYYSYYCIERREVHMKRHHTVFLLSSRSGAD